MAEMRTLYFKADEDADWAPVSLHAVDAAHALEVDPDHWKQNKPEPEPQPEPVDPVIDPPATTEGTEQ